MKIQPGDYAISRSRNASGKFIDALIKVKSVSESNVFGRLEHDPHIKNHQVELPKDTLIVNLGPKPYSGSVYGFDLKSLYLGTKTHPDIGEVHFFERIKPETREILFDAMSAAYKKYKKHGIDISKLPLVHEFRPTKGKMAGQYKHSKNVEKNPHRVVYCPDPKLSPDQYEYVILHEWAHVIDFNLIHQNAKAHAKWIKVYNGSIAPNCISKDVSKTVMKLFAGSETDTVSEWFSTLEDEDIRRAAKHILIYLRQIRSLSILEINALMASGDKDEVTRLWPKVEIDIRDTKPLVTEYATRNVYELVAESISLYLTGKELPEPIPNLVEQTLRLAKINFKEYA